MDPDTCGMWFTDSDGVRQCCNREFDHENGCDVVEERRDAE